MYKNMFWFTLGYLTCKHGVPILNEVARKMNEKKREQAG
jgi:hypothetical protein